MTQTSAGSDVLAVIKRIKSALGVKTDVDLAKSLELSNKTISSWKKREKIPMDVISVVSSSSGESIEFLLNGTKTYVDKLGKLSLDKDVIDIISEDIFKSIVSQYDDEASLMMSDDEIRENGEYIGSYIRVMYNSLLSSKKKLVEDAGISLEDFREVHRLSKDATIKSVALSMRLRRKR